MGAIIFVAFGLIFFFVLPRIGRSETDSPAVKAADLKVPQENAGYVIKGGADIELFLVKARILEINENEYGLPIAVCDAKLLSGGIFHRTETDCLIIANTAHTNDYFKYCLTIRVQGKSAFLSIRYYGESKLGQGRETVKQLVMDNPELAEELTQKIVEAMENGVQPTTK